MPLSLRAVYCASRGACTAVGTVLENPCYVGCGAVPNANVLRLVILSEQREKWSASPPLDSRRGLQAPSSLGLDCLTGTSCVVTGAITQKENEPAVAFIGVGSGLHWVFTRAPEVFAGGEWHRLSSVGPVTCSSACTMAGVWYDTQDRANVAAVSGTPGRWTATRLPLPPDASNSDNLTVDGTACVDPRTCVIAGEYDGRNGAEPLVYRSLHHRWFRSVVPLPRGAQVGGQSALACAPQGPCRIFSSYFFDPGAAYHFMVLSTAGRGWTRSPVISGQHVYLGYPVAADCPSASSCVATAGAAYIIGPAAGPWKAVSISSPAPNRYDAGLEGLDCAAAGYCVGAGSYRDRNGYQQGLIDTLNGPHQTTITAPVPPGGGLRPRVSLSAISCPSLGACFALGYPVGSTDLFSGTYAVIETYRSGSWSPTVVPLPRGTEWLTEEQTMDESYRLPAEIACPSTTSCTAMGILLRLKHSTYAVLELTLAAGRWSSKMITVPGVPDVFPSASQVTIDSLSCPAVGACAAAGFLYRQDQRQSYELVLQQERRGWSIHRYPSGPGEGFMAVSCWRAGRCTAVGETIAASSGDHWRDLGPAGYPWFSYDAVLNDVSCARPGTCAAVTGYNPAVPARKPFIDSYQSGKWASFTRPGWLPGDNQPYSGPEIVACPGPNDCLAVGVNASQRAMVWAGLGRHWTPTALPEPTGGSGPAFTTGIACASTASCLITGINNYGRPVLWVRADGRWLARNAPEPAKPQQGDFIGDSQRGIACPAPGACVAIGRYTMPNGLQRGFFEEQSGFR